MTQPVEPHLEQAFPADDRGLAYGDGVFETMAAVDGRVAGLALHLDRLERGCAVLGYAPPSREAVTRAVESRAAGSGRCVLKLIVTRGSGGRGYLPPESPLPRMHVAVFDWPTSVSAQRSEGVDAVRLQLRLADQPALAGIKHLARLEQVLAAAELARHAPAAEGVVGDARGAPLCGVMSNLFLVRRRVLVTPSLERCGIAGIIRGALLGLAEAGELPPVSVRAVTPGELDDADEVFMTNSIRGVVPVRRLDTRDLGPPGPVARAAQAALHDAGLMP